MAGGSRTRLELQVGPLAAGDLLVRRVTGQESLSTPYRFEVELEPRSGEPLALADLVAQAALLSIRRHGGTERLVHGVVERAELAGVDRDRPRYRLRLVPRLALLGQAVGSRIFQDQTAVDAVQKVLGEGRVSLRRDLAADPPQRAFCVQYRESGLAFARRLLEDEGIFFSFEHAEGDHLLVLSDDVKRCPAIAGAALVPYRDEGLAGEEEGDEHVFALARCGAVRVDQATLRDFDFERPELDLTATQRAGQSGVEWYEYPAGHRDVGEGRRRAGLRVEELRGPVEEVEGRSSCLRLLPGATFEIDGAPDPATQGKLLVLEVEHEAVQLESAGEVGPVEHRYANRFRARPAAVPYRPPRRTPRPRLRGVQTATVVGPAGEEIHPDAHGRVKVRFHWDREGPSDDGASCWLRLAQGWAGAGFGASLVPRAGQEAVVAFLEGDPDRPLALGAVYNGAHAPPLGLPAEKTRSTQRSDSSPGGGGSNELRLEDAADAEEVTLHAQKDQHIVVEADKRQEVRRDEAHQVVKDRSQQVQGGQRLGVSLVDGTQVEGNRTLAVTGNRSVTVAMSHREQVAAVDSVKVGGAQKVTVMATSLETVGAAAALTIGGAYAISVAGILNEAVGGLKASQVGGAHLIWVKGSRDERVEKEASYECGGDSVADVKKGAVLSAGSDQSDDVGGEAGLEVKEGVGWLAQRIVLEATDELSIVVAGKQVLSVKKSGDITFGVTSLSVDGSDIVLKGSKVQKASSGSASSGSAPVTQLEVLRNPRAAVQLAMVDQAGTPMANQPFRVELPDGSVVEGVTDGSGKAAIPGSKEGDAKVTFTGLDGRLVKKG